MKKNILIITGMLALGMAGSNVSAQTVIHDPRAALRQVKGFHGIQVSDGIDLYLSKGNEEAVAVSGSDDKWRDRIRTVVHDGILTIWLQGPIGSGWKAVHHRLRAYISFTTLDQLSASGESDVYVDGVISGASLSINLSGSSDFRGAVHLDELKVDQSGASDALITGSVTNEAHIEVSGASRLRGYALQTGSCDARASGASEIQITVDKDLSAHASGASRVHYRGDGVIREQHTSGASSISKKG